MIKNIMYGSIALFFIVLSFCAIFAVSAYRSPKASVHTKYGDYQQRVSNAEDGAEAMFDFLLIMQDEKKERRVF